MDVPTVFRRRYGPIPPIRKVSGRDGANWAGTVGQTRILELGGKIDGELPVPLIRARVRLGITWRYTMYPRARLATPALPVFGWFWRGYARQMLEELSNLLFV